MDLPLKGKWIVITRPSHQALHLQEKLESAGANIILFPLLEINPPDNLAQAKQSLSRLNSFQLAIFTSANAVEYTLQHVSQSAFSHTRIAAIGKKTASLLKSYGLTVDYFPATGFNSEALLAIPRIKLYGDGDNIAILRGQGGRELLKHQLESQGARVDYIDVYKRTFPQQNLDLLKQHYEQHELDMILITSGSSLDNLFRFLPDNDWLNKTSLLVGSQRIKKHLLRYSSYQGQLLSTQDPSDDALYQRLLTWGMETR